MYVATQLTDLGSFQELTLSASLQAASGGTIGSVIGTVGSLIDTTAVIVKDRVVHIEHLTGVEITESSTGTDVYAGLNGADVKSGSTHITVTPR